MRKWNILVVAGVLIASASIGVLAATDPEGVLNKVADTVPALDLDVSSLEENWINWANDQRWGSESYIGGVQQFSGRGIIASSGVAYVNVRIGQPGWNEARIVAYERAELEAKSKLVAFLIDNITNGRNTSYLEKAQFNDGQIQEIRDISEVAETLTRWGEKSVRLTDAVFDKLIGMLDENYDRDSLNKLPVKQQKIVVEAMFKRAVTRFSVRSLSGVTTVYNTESVAGNQYEMLVGVLWTPKLNRLAASIQNDGYNIPKLPSGRNINQWVDGMGANLLGMWGTRIMVDEDGHYTVVAFAQAEPRRASSARQQSAIHRAKGIAENRGRAMISNFVTEKVALSDSESSREIFQELDDRSSATQITRDVQKTIQGRKKSIKLRGIRTIKKWSMDHPATGQKVAGSVIIWSPSSRQMSEDMENAMRYRPVTPETKKQKAVDKKMPQKIIESMTIETSAY